MDETEIRECTGQIKWKSGCTPGKAHGRKEKAAPQALPSGNCWRRQLLEGRRDDNPAVPQAQNCRREGSQSPKAVGVSTPTSYSRRASEGILMLLTQSCVLPIPSH